MHMGNIIATALFLLMVSLTVYQERRWRHRLRYWKLADGEVIGFHCSDGTKMMIVEFFVQGERRECRPDYTFYNNKVGTALPVLYDPESADAALYTARHRWFPTAILLLMSLFLLLPVVADWG